MIHICFLISSLCNEGPVNVLYNIIKYMDFTKFQVSIITFIPEKTNSRMSEFKEFPIKIIQLATCKFLNPIAMFRHLRNTVEQLSPDILHAHCPRSLYLMYFLNHKYIKAYTIHNYPGELQRILYGKYKGELVIQLNHFFTKRIDLPICCAPNIKQDYAIKKGWNFICIPNGSSLPIWNYQEEEKMRIRQSLDLKPDVCYFIFISRFSQEKNPEKLINAFLKLNDPTIGLIMLGDGPLWPSLKIKATENILLPGFKTNISDYLIAADIYISASNGEGLANTLLESMSVGLPMLLSDIPSHRIIFEDLDESAGSLFNLADENDLFSKIEQVKNLNRQQAASKIQALFSKKYTAEKMSVDYQKTFADFYYQKLKKTDYKI